ncbi:hypothetical protein HK098_003543 [Nowakowskiella sp. JEL0407]|nr:hypothetical protein HK098_003543 [Nowakowskiella sp. JEL0407]
MSVTSPSAAVPSIAKLLQNPQNNTTSTFNPPPAADNSQLSPSIIGTLAVISFVFVALFVYAVVVLIKSSLTRKIIWNNPFKRRKSFSDKNVEIRVDLSQHSAQSPAIKDNFQAKNAEYYKENYQATVSGGTNNMSQVSTLRNYVNNDPIVTNNVEYSYPSVYSKSDFDTLSKHSLIKQTHDVSIQVDSQPNSAVAYSVPTVPTQSITRSHVPNTSRFIEMPHTQLSSFGTTTLADSSSSLDRSPHKRKSAPNMSSPGYKISRESTNANTYFGENAIANGLNSNNLNLLSPKSDASSQKTPKASQINIPLTSHPSVPDDLDLHRPFSFENENSTNHKALDISLPKFDFRRSSNFLNSAKTQRMSTSSILDFIHGGGDNLKRRSKSEDTLRVFIRPRGPDDSLSSADAESSITDGALNQYVPSDVGTNGDAGNNTFDKEVVETPVTGKRERANSSPAWPKRKMSLARVPDNMKVELAGFQ